MEGGPLGSDDLLRRFEAAVAGSELDDLRRLPADVGRADWHELRDPERPDLRRPSRDEVAVYRVRVDLDGASPPIWRRLDLRSDLTLDVVHRVLQAAFGWFDYHLHRFSIGGGPFDPHSQIFLCSFDVAEGEDDGVPVAEVRLDETLQEPGDVLSYLYDYGDNWDLTIRLEELLPADDAPAAVCVDGARAAPPEDCGGLTRAEDLAEVLDDPAHFDVDEVNAALAGPYFVLHVEGVRAPLLELVYRLQATELGSDLAATMLSLTTPVPKPSTEEKADALRAFRWFVDRAQGDGLELTAAGYLKPSDVQEVSQLLPRMSDWIGKNNREINATPLLWFRESLQRLGILRKYKGRLRLTRAAARLAADPEALWAFLADKLAQESGDRFTDEASLLVLAEVAGSFDGSHSLEKVAAALIELGWIKPDGQPVSRWDVFHLELFEVLRNVGELPGDWAMNDRVSPEAAALARAALLPGRPDR